MLFESSQNRISVHMRHFEPVRKIALPCLPSLAHPETLMQLLIGHGATCPCSDGIHMRKARLNVSVEPNIVRISDASS